MFAGRACDKKRTQYLLKFFCCWRLLTSYPGFYGYPEEHAPPQCSPMVLRHASFDKRQTFYVKILIGYCSSHSEGSGNITLFCRAEVTDRKEYFLFPVSDRT